MGQYVGATGYTNYSVNNCTHDGHPDYDEFFTIILGSTDKNPGRSVVFVGSKEFKALDNVDDKSTLIIGMTGKKLSAPKDVIVHCDLKIDARKYELKKNFKEVAIDCTDMAAPRVFPSFWLELRREIEHGDFEKIICYCMGGHGRTGTALVCLYLSFFSDNAVHAIKLIKRVYCKNAVESKEQVEYVAHCAKLFDQYFRKQEDGARLAPLVLPKRVKRVKETKKGTVVVVDANKYNVGPTEYGDDTDDPPFLDLICSICNLRDNTVMESEVNGSTIMECDNCYQDRIKSAALDGKLDFASADRKTK